MKIPRNARCPCGSGKKFKNCHLRLWEEGDKAEPAHLPPHRLIGELTKLPEVTEALEEAHHFWHESALAYQDPERFRLNVNAFVQAARNVTFRLQSRKELVPAFDSWYARWQTYMRGREELLWLNEARVRVVHRAGLESRSKARVSLVWSHDEPDAVELELSPLLSTEELVKIAAAGVPQELLGNSAVEVERRWEVDDLPGKELLDALAECLRVMVALVEDLREQLTGQVGSMPEHVVARTPLAQCMERPEESRRIRMNPATGELYVHETIKGEFDPASYEKIAKKYNVEPLGSDVNVEDPIEYAKALIPHAVKVLRRDGYHIPLLMLHRPDGGWQRQVMLAGDKLDKYLLWKKAAAEVRKHGYDGLVFISEAWVAPAEQVPSHLYPELEKVPGRLEVLAVTAAAPDGRRLHVNIPFRKRFGRVLTGEPEEMEVHEGGFIAPIVRVWAERGAENSKRTET